MQGVGLREYGYGMCMGVCVYVYGVCIYVWHVYGCVSVCICVCIYG